MSNDRSVTVDRRCRVTCGDVPDHRGWLLNTIVSHTRDVMCGRVIISIRTGHTYGQSIVAPPSARPPPPSCSRVSRVCCECQLSQGWVTVETDITDLSGSNVCVLGV